jgi:hypothetical protein
LQNSLQSFSVLTPEKFSFHPRKFAYLNFFPTHQVIIIIIATITTPHDDSRLHFSTEKTPNFCRKTACVRRSTTACT